MSEKTPLLLTGDEAATTIADEHGQEIGIAGYPYAQAEEVRYIPPMQPSPAAERIDKRNKKLTTVVKGVGLVVVGGVLGAGINHTANSPHTSQPEAAPAAQPAQEVQPPAGEEEEGLKDISEVTKAAKVAGKMSLDAYLRGKKQAEKNPFQGSTFYLEETSRDSLRVSQILRVSKSQDYGDDVTIRQELGTDGGTRLTIETEDSHTYDGKDGELDMDKSTWHETGITFEAPSIPYTKKLTPDKVKGILDSSETRIVEVSQTDDSGKTMTYDSYTIGPKGELSKNGRTLTTPEATERAAGAIRSAVTDITRDAADF